ncbi:MAG: hypothetical protein LUQ36_00685 [Methanoregula sp.]|jgi:hypothetical protein|nr:hypothetical protein [Methanoregula sp.]
MKRVVIAGIICLMLLQGIGVVAADDPPDYSKIVIVHLNINQSGITEKSIEMRYGHAPNLETRYGDFKGTLKSADGSTIREFDLWDPRYQLGDVLEKDNDSSGYLSGYLSYSDNADLILILPYYEKQVMFELHDKKTGTLLKKVNMSEAITKFQSHYPKDPGSVSVSPFQFDKPVVYVITGVVISILIIGMILSMIRKK